MTTLKASTVLIVEGGASSDDEPTSLKDVQLASKPCSAGEGPSAVAQRPKKATTVCLRCCQARRKLQTG